MRLNSLVLPDACEKSEFIKKSSVYFKDFTFGLFIFKLWVDSHILKVFKRVFILRVYDHRNRKRTDLKNTYDNPFGMCTLLSSGRNISQNILVLFFQASTQGTRASSGYVWPSLVGWSASSIPRTTLLGPSWGFVRSLKAPTWWGPCVAARRGKGWRSSLAPLKFVSRKMIYYIQIDLICGGKPQTCYF